MKRALVILRAIVTVFMPARRNVVASDRSTERARDAGELEAAARERNSQATCRLIATAERIVLAQRPEQMNGSHKAPPPA